MQDSADTSLTKLKRIGEVFSYPPCNIVWEGLSGMLFPAGRCEIQCSQPGERQNAEQRPKSGVAGVTGLRILVPQGDLFVQNVDPFLFFRIPNFDIGLGHAVFPNGDFVRAVRVVGVRQFGGVLRFLGLIGLLRVLRFLWVFGLLRVLGLLRVG